MTPPKQIPDKYIFSAVIGMWRMGASDMEIALANNLSGKQVDTIIKIYKTDL